MGDLLLSTAPLLVPDACSLVSRLTHVFALFSQMRSNATVATLFERQADVDVVDGVFQLSLNVNSIVTITSMLNVGSHGVHPSPPDPEPFPLPYADDFNG
jgi:hypothetical protein